MGRWLLASLVMLSFTVTARADVFVIAPPYFTGSDGERVSDEIVRAIQRDLSSQYRVLGPMEAAALVEKEERVWCRKGACAERYREAAGAVAAIVVRVDRVGGGSGPATSFQIGIQPSPGIEYTKGALLDEGPVGELAVKALREAFHEYRQGPGPWLEVTGAPEGAAVYVDDREVGTLPCTLAVSTGNHRVRVEARTFAPVTKLVSLQSATDRKTLDFRLEPERVVLKVGGSQQGPARESLDGESGPGLLWKDPLFYAGAVGVAAGGGLLGLAVSNRIHSGGCDERDSADVCVEFDKLGSKSKILLGTGVSLAVVGVSLLTWRIVNAVEENRTWHVNVAVGRSALGFTVGKSL